MVLRSIWRTHVWCVSHILIASSVTELSVLCCAEETIFSFENFSIENKNKFINHIPFKFCPSKLDLANKCTLNARAEVWNWCASQMLFVYNSKQCHFLLNGFRCETKMNAEQKKKLRLRNGFSFIQHNFAAMSCEWQCDEKKKTSFSYNK